MSQQPRLERVTEVMSRTGLSRATIYRHMAAGRFPRPCKLTGPAANAPVGWAAAEVDAWIAERMACRVAS